MALKQITYLEGNKKNKINVEVCDTILKKSRGLMFRKNSPPLLFTTQQALNDLVREGELVFTYRDPCSYVEMPESVGTTPAA